MMDVGPRGVLVMMLGISVVLRVYMACAFLGVRILSTVSWLFWTKHIVKIDTDSAGCRQLQDLYDVLTSTYSTCRRLAALSPRPRNTDVHSYSSTNILASANLLPNAGRQGGIPAGCILLYFLGHHHLEIDSYYIIIGPLLQYVICW